MTATSTDTRTATGLDEPGKYRVTWVDETTMALDDWDGDATSAVAACFQAGQVVGYPDTAAFVKVERIR